MKKLKKIISMICLVAVLATCSTNVVFAETLHKVNGAGTEVGGALEYTSTTTRSCNKIKAMGDSVPMNRRATVTVYLGNTIVAQGTILLDGNYHTLTKSGAYVSKNFPAATYTIKVIPLFHSEYGVSTFFYYWYYVISSTKS